MHGEDAPIKGVQNGEEHILTLRVYYADTDFSGVVYHARYLEFFERGRSEYLRAHGIFHSSIGAPMAEGDRAMKSAPLFFTIRHIGVDFIKPARIDDVLSVHTKIAKSTPLRLSIGQMLYCGPRLLAKAEVECIMVNDKGRPQRLPQAWLARFNGA